MPGEAEPKNGDQTLGIGARAEGEDHEYKVQDRRHWAAEDEEPGEDGSAETEARKPTVIDEYRARATDAEQKLQEYIEAYKDFRQEQETVRQRLTRDVERRVELQFADLLTDLLETLDDLDRTLAHAGDLAEAAPIVKGVRLVRERFLSGLRRHGVEELDTDGKPFDPNEAEAVRMDEVSDAAHNGVVTETLRVGYKLGDRVVRPARVAVGRHVE